MNQATRELVNAFEALHVTVVGDAMLDSYLKGSSDRLCQEAPVPVISLSERDDVPGGAANTAVNVAALGARASLVSVVGDDAEGDVLRRALVERGVATEQVVAQRGRRTLTKQRIVSDGQLIGRVDQGSTGPTDGVTEGKVLEDLHAAFPACDALIVSDYGYGVITPRVIDSLAQLQADAPRLVVVDAKDLVPYRRVGATAVKPNHHQAMRLLDGDVLQRRRASADSFASHGERLLELTGAHIAAVTLDADGALVFERGKPPYRTYARPAKNARAAGAGDTFVSALTLALAAGAHTPAAAELASGAAAVVVGKEGTATCSALELRQYASPETKFFTDVDALVERIDFYRRQGRRVVFTNGCFDILHRGHITYLNRAKALGDVLVVGINSDEGVTRLKGPGRPINALDDRVEVLAALSSVDHIVPFNEDTPAEIVRRLRPDVFAKGGDYTRDMLPEAPVVEELGGVVHILPYVEDRSTTGIIERVRAALRTSDDAATARDRP